jgi:murein DD-endopeptidase MepM/ murein hydrolase activator NlpD
VKCIAILRPSLATALVSAVISVAQPTPAFANACIQVPVNCRVTSTFGARFNPITRNYSSEFHHGVDFGCPVGTPDTAAEGGIVAVAGTSESAGNWVVVKAAGGQMVYKYMHHSKLVVSPGVMVNAGQLLAYTGNTGRSTGPHLHFQVEQNKVAVDPYARFCTKPPLKDGVLQGADVPLGDVLDPGSQATAPSGGTPPAMGMDGSLDEVIADVIASRALNPDYAAQISTLSEPRLYAELAYMQTIRLKIRHERNLHKERMLATEAMVQILMTERTLAPQLSAQRRAASTVAQQKR